MMTHFQVFVSVNEVIPVDHCVLYHANPLSQISIFPVYRTQSENPRYTTDSGCELLGSFTIANTSNIPFHDQEIVVTFMFGLTELLVKAKHMHTLKEEVLTLDCLK
ncbi:hypothetical protein DPMN_185719 [Dreissena polymorpha]|uniref:Uncharacterized protein n=1 Tax=Dreissena polymorpha TaxID=45954 RepID=A0A9D4DMF3_DREPO|nr:hypothetical protein DPMN_185719 [Dreissena polymorpha]